MNSDMQKGLLEAARLVEMARTRRKRWGMCENLGYSKRPELDYYIGKLKLTYQECCSIQEAFTKMCDELNKET